ncbi:MAG: dihydropteroate synthase [Magnetospiraceae bacterium]
MLSRASEKTPRFVGSEAAVQQWAAAQGTVVFARVDAQLTRCAAPPATYAGLALDRPLIMGIVNVTPDSFSDGGDFLDPAAAIAHGEALISAGADILDIGGESTRPGARMPSVQEEIDRVIPVVAGLRGAGVPLSVDTRRAPVMDAALAAGATIINDVSALTSEPEALPLVAARRAPVVLMHMQGEPGNMQKNPHYDDALLDVYDYLEKRVDACVAAGLPRNFICIDPGIGFGKNDAHNLRLMAGLALFRGLGCPILLGVSRKSLIGRLAQVENPKERLPGSLALALAGVARGAHILRVHDVAETRQALMLWSAVEPSAGTLYQRP